MENMFDLTGKKAMVTGGAGGIGIAIAKGMAVFGADTAIAGRTESSLKKAVEEIREETGKEVRYYIVDASDEESIHTFVAKSEEEMGGVDILVNSQGYNKSYGCFDCPVEEWDKHFYINVRGVMLASVGYARHMQKRHWGRIINVSSIRGLCAAPGGGGAMAYGTTKSALNMLTKQLAAELASKGITVNAICPTVIKTPMMAERMTEEFEYRMKAKIPVGRVGKPEDCVGLCILYASDAGAFLTGQITGVDGGLAML